LVEGITNHGMEAFVVQIGEARLVAGKAGDGVSIG
jgi:hypothetical protein